ncbi:MAG: hypothetical protein DYG98_11340 [Haliscomenobacteraceae bacterium CHB4]|nr:hypothetical protein [Haliscomenobacteraceae bacterium CHB4]
MNEDKIKKFVAISGLILSAFWLIRGGEFEAAISTISSGAAVILLFWSIRIPDESIKRAIRILEWLFIGITVACILYGIISLVICHELGIRIKNM